MRRAVCSSVGGVLLAGCLVTAWTGCSVRQMAVRGLGDSLASSARTFARDDDPKLVEEALPFALKMMEGLLLETPRNRDLLLATCRGFTQYTYAFVEQEADRVEATDLAQAERMRDRARKLYLRARDYGIRAIEVQAPEFWERVRKNPRAVLAGMSEEDVPYLYWTATSWAAAISVSRDRPRLIADLPTIGKIMGRALELDPDFNRGAIHTFMISYAMAAPGLSSEEARSQAIDHFEKAVALSEGQLAAPYVNYAESVAVAAQNKQAFRSKLKTALAIDPDQLPESRLNNILMQERAEWLLGRTEELFWEPTPARTEG